MMLVLISNKGAVLYKLGRHKESIAEFDIALRIDPNNTICYNNRAIILKILEKNQEQSK